MKKLYAVLGLVGVMAAPNLYAAWSYDGDIKVTYAGGAGDNAHNGGAYNAVTKGALGDFVTFCLEFNEDVRIGAWYKYQENTGAVAGGVSGQDGTDPNTGLSMDSVSIGTAWLYSSLRNGTLAAHGYTDANQGSALQAAIWWLEGETYGANNGFVALAKAALGRDDTTIKADSKGAFGVIALNLYDGPYGKLKKTKDGVSYYVNQDVLAIVPEPTTILAGALLLLPFGASTIRILRRKA